ncbi:MAG: hypothetical protein H0V66_13960 [Bdellovibrionales bacterium]|nr:hypothetical protein [Bdellovibrionales bacterium]
MKKQLVVALGLTVLAAPAFASKARLQALGEDVNGSFYINDNRNVFLNAAQVNNHKDLVTFEWGDTTNGTDNAATPRAEGGVFKTMGNMVYGLYLGSESNTSNFFRSASGVTIAEENNIDLFVAGDAGIKWGANLTYSKSADDETNGDANQSALRTRFGVIAGDIEGYANINIDNKAESGVAGNEFDGKLGYKVGAIYNLNDYRVFADYQSFEGEADGAIDGDLESTQLQVGAGRSTRLNDKATLFTRAQYTQSKSDIDVGTSADQDIKSKAIPVVIGLEYDAASWLVLRSSIGQNIWSTVDNDGNKSPAHETTVVNAGATLKFGELSVDGVIGNNDGVDTTGTGANTAAGNGNLRTDNLMSRVSMTYRF